MSWRGTVDVELGNFNPEELAVLDEEFDPRWGDDDVPISVIEDDYDYWAYMEMQRQYESYPYD